MRAMRFAVVAHRSTETNGRLAEAASACGVEGLVLAPRDALRLLEPGDAALARLDVRESLDGVESGISELDRLAEAGVRVLNPAASLIASHDKLLTARVLRLARLPHPRTWLIGHGMPAPMPELPVVLKPRFGSWGRDVTRCDTQEELDAALVAAAGTSWFREHGALAQALVPPLGWDLRLVVARGRVVGAAQRVATRGEWRTNASLGSRVEPVSPPPLARTLAIAAAEAVRADLVGVDLLPTRSGFVVLELNGAVDVRPLYSLAGDVYRDAVVELLRAVAEGSGLAAVGA